MKCRNRVFYTHCIFLPLFMIYMFILMNNILFLHSHTLSDGTVIFHAHPYHKTGGHNSGENHHHSGFEYIVIKHFQTYYHEEVYYNLTGCSFHYKILLHVADKIYVPCHLKYSGTRAPPIHV